MKYFTWGMNKPKVSEQRAALQQDHWRFWDDYDSRLVARGPVLDADDRTTAIGSIHIAELNTWAEARHMVYEEPYAKAGLFQEIVLTPFSLELGRTQFQTESPPGSSGFFIHCRAVDGGAMAQGDHSAGHEAYCREYDSIFACRGSLLTESGSWDGSIYLIEVANGDAAAEFIDQEPYKEAGLYDSPLIFNWRRGGRR